ncbi:MAG: alpha/beta hydrolase [Lachnospiraceae bacterium]|nr:alpha/beta hydrolase [Lachnospiraceae bacterium]
MSLSAKAAVQVLRAVKKAGFMPGIDKNLDHEIARAKEYNRKHRYKEPTDHKALYKTVQIGGYPTLIIRSKSVHSHHNKAILFLHGGGDRDTWKPEVAFARTYANRTGADLFYPIYPPFTEVSVKNTADLIYTVYQRMVRKYGASHIAVVGGSYGGFLALQLLTWMNKNGNAVDMPRLMILNSPFAFPETAEEWELAREYEKNDPMMPEGAMQFMMDGVLWSDPHTPDYALYPDKMDFRHAPETYVYYTEEVCACVAEAIRAAYDHDGSGERMHMHIEPGMMHCYACAPVFPESRRDFNRQIDLIKSM